ncbi:MAG: hypothetical protein QW176_08695, partial [Candidatus Bathyarchaeia archaeon]
MSEGAKGEETVSRRKYLATAGGLAVATAVGWGLAGYLASRPPGPPVERTVTSTVTKTVTAAPTPVATPTATPTWTPPGGKYPWEERPAEYYQPITPGLEALNLIIDYAAFSSPTIEAGFLKSTGIKNINVDVYTDELKMFAKIKPGGHGYDLIHLHYVPDPKDPKNRPGLWKRQQIDLGEGPFLEPIDMRVMSNFKDGLYPSVEFWEKICKWDGKWYTIPHELFIDAPASNRDYVSDEEASTIEMLWNPKFRNRIAMPDFIMSVVVGGIYTGAKFPW